MAWSIEHDAEHCVTVIKVTETLTLEEGKTVTRLALASAEEHGADRVLIDASELAGWISPVDILELINDYAVASPRRGMLVALIQSRSSALHENLRFYETASQNRGYMVRLFAHRTDALQWLRPR